MIMKRLAVLAACLAITLIGVGGCVNAPTASTVVSSAVTDAEKALIAARAAHATACGGVVKAHATGLLTGKNFNISKRICISVDSQLDAAGTLMSVGRSVDAIATINQAKSDLGRLPQ